MSKKSQVAMEFLYVIGIVIFISIILSKVVLNYYEEKRNYENIDVAKEIVLNVENEIMLASKVNPGYLRSFEIPENLNNVDYNISVSYDEIVLIYENMSFASRIPNVTGDVLKGVNTIRNVNNKICLNIESC